MKVFMSRFDRGENRKNNKHINHVIRVSPVPGCNDVRVGVHCTPYTVRRTPYVGI